MKQNDSKIGIIGAMTVEVAKIVEQMEVIQTIEYPLGKVHEGKLFGKDVVVTTSGVGKVFVSATTQFLCERYNLEYIVFTGVGGAINSLYEIGDVVVATELIQYDMDASKVGFELGEIPYTGIRYIETDTDIIQRLNDSELKLHFGIIGTGDTFVSTQELREKIASLGCMLVDMESAAFAVICWLHKVKFIVIRSVSDTADESASESFEVMTPRLADKNLLVIKFLLST